MLIKRCSYIGGDYIEVWLYIFFQLRFKIQYSLGKPGGGHPNTFCPFLGVKCKDEKKTCQGVKLCSIAASELKNTIHSGVDPDTGLSLSRNPSFLTISSSHQIRLNTQE